MFYVTMLVLRQKIDRLIRKRSPIPFGKRIKRVVLKNLKKTHAIFLKNTIIRLLFGLIISQQLI